MKKQQQQLHSFFHTKKKKSKEEKKEVQPPPRETESPTASDINSPSSPDKENELSIANEATASMGCKSQDRKSAIQKAKEHTFSIQNALREAAARGEKVKTNNAQRKLDGTVADPRCDDPDNPRECRACTKTEQYKLRGKVFKNFAHHFSCPHNKEYLENLFGPKSESTKRFDAEAKRVAKENSRPLPGPDLHVRKEDGIAFFSPRSGMPRILSEAPIAAEALRTPIAAEASPPSPDSPTPPVREKFLSEYLVDQIQRRAKIERDPKSNRCMCTSCGAHPDAKKRLENQNALDKQHKRPPPLPEPVDHGRFSAAVEPPSVAMQPLAQPVMQQAVAPQPFAVAANPPQLVPMQAALTISMPQQLYPYPQVPWYRYVPIVTSNQGSYSDLMKRARLG